MEGLIFGILRCFCTGSADSSSVLTAYLSTPVSHVRSLCSLGGLSFLLLAVLLSRLAGFTASRSAPSIRRTVTCRWYIFRSLG